MRGYVRWLGYVPEGDLRSNPLVRIMFYVHRPGSFGCIIFLRIGWPTKINVPVHGFAVWINLCNSTQTNNLIRQNVTFGYSDYSVPKQSDFNLALKNNKKYGNFPKGVSIDPTAPLKMYYVRFRAFKSPPIWLVIRVRVNSNAILKNTIKKTVTRHNR